MENLLWKNIDAIPFGFDKALSGFGKDYIECR